MNTKSVRSVFPGTSHEDTHFGFLLDESRFLSSRYAWVFAWLPTPHFSMEAWSSKPPRTFPRWSGLPQEIKDAILNFAFSVPQGEGLPQITLTKHYYDPMEPDALRRTNCTGNFAADAVLIGSSEELVQLFVSKEFLRIALPHLARHRAMTVQGCS